MKAESVLFGVAGMLFGVIVGWIIGSQQAERTSPAPAAQAAPAERSTGNDQQRAVLDETRVRALQTIATGDPKNAEARVELANVYFEGERYQDAIKWYEEALSLDPKNVNASTALGVSYYYTNQTDRALKQFDHSLAVDPRHTRTLLSQGMVRAFGKQDLAGATASWQRVVELAPDSPEGREARRALESVRAAHPGAS
jgi:cytochrome c-type biogenesis protein CcmH/NrfG